ncbi:MAG: metallophosphoesterase [Clostridia bacterium]|nr:metallophosphoesterase [Clostridia bacterium]
MIYLYIFLFLIIILAYMRFEASWVQVKHVRFTKSKDPLKVLHLSDLHVHRLKVSYAKIKQMIAFHNPDLIIISGDFIEKSAHIPKALHFLQYIKDEHKAFLCLGNHDYEVFLNNEEGLKEYICSIQNTGYSVLHNACYTFEKKAKKYNLIGIEDIRYNRQDIEKALSLCDKDAAMNIAFSHNPDLVLQFQQGQVDYLFCGHFHGGQIWAPFDFEFKLLRNEKLCKMGIKRGLHKVNGINLYINRGLGNVCFPLRFFSRPEITIYYLP